MKRFLISTAFASSMLMAATASHAAEELTYLFPAPDFLPAFAPFQIAKGKGYFADADLDVTFQIGKGGADVATQVAVGNADLGGGIGDTPIVVRSNRLEVKGVALLGGRGLTQLAWRADSGITGPKDFVGKKIGVLSFQDTTYYNLLAVLAAEGLSKNDVSIQAVGPGGLVQLMISGDLDGISGVPEWIASVEGAGVKLEQMPVDEVFPAMAQAILASDKTIAERPEVISGFVNAVLKAVRDIEADPHQATLDYVSFVPQHKGKEAEIERILRDYATKVYPAGPDQKLGTFDPARVSEVQKFYIDNGIIRAASPVEDLVTNGFIE